MDCGHEIAYTVPKMGVGGGKKKKKKEREEEEGGRSIFLNGSSHPSSAPVVAFYTSMKIKNSNAP